MLSPVLGRGARARELEVRQGGDVDVENQQVLGGIPWRLRK
jgi:hypothetical protein